MTDGQTAHTERKNKPQETPSPIDLLIADILGQALGLKPEQINRGTGASKAEASGIDPAIDAQLDAIFSAIFGTTIADPTYGEELVGYDLNKTYNPVVKEILLDFANAINILNNCRGSTPPAIRATETAIGHIQTACFWAQNALSGSKF